MPSHPYAERVHLSADKKTTYLWPFADKPARNAPVELMLDNNALVDHAWLRSLQRDLAMPLRNISINPWLALAEQWLSNVRFREAPLTRIDAYLRPFRNHGFAFPENYASVQAERLRTNDAQLRYYHALTFGYLMVLKKLVDAPKGSDMGHRRLLELSRADVPRLTGCLLLGCLILLLKAHPQIRWNGDSVRAFSYVQSFFAFKTERNREPNYVGEAYLRNRAGDLALWYGFPMLQLQKVEWGGDPVLVTHDTALTNLIFRMLPPMWGSENDKAIRFSPAFVELQDDWLKWDELIQSVNLNFTLLSSEDKLRRLQNLFAFARGCCTCDEEVFELHDAWQTWIEPGFDLAFCVS